MLNDINLNLYKIFYVVATTKSFKKASEKLFVSQPAISKQIKKLESFLDIKLFYRCNKGIELTNEGQLLLEYIEKMNFYLEASLKYINKSKNLIEGELIIGCPSHITSFYLLNYIEKFKKDYNNINIKIINDSTFTLIDLLEHHKIDFIIDNFPYENTNGNYLVKSIKTYDTVFIVSSKNNKIINKITDLETEKFILPLPRSSMRKKLERKLREYVNFELNTSLAVDTTDLIISSVKKNLGIGYVIKEAVIEDIENGNIKILDIDCELPNYELNLIYLKDYLTYPAKEFLEKYIKAI